jgi:hypothetical protein
MEVQLGLAWSMAIWVSSGWSTRQLRSITTAKQFARLIFADYLVSNVPKLTGKLCEP